jgi:hypothetical protein
MNNILQNLGFTPNTKVINGYQPKYRKGADVLFLIGSDYWPGKIAKIGIAYKDYDGKIYGVLTPKAPPLAAYDWVTNSNLILLKPFPLSKAQWNKEGTDIEYVKTTV